MDKLQKYAQHFTKLELMRARLEVFQNEMKRSEIRPELKNQLIPGQSGREGVDFIVKTKSGNYHELYLQPINLETERSVKITKTVLGEPKDNLWVVLVLFMKDINEQVERFKHLSNWEIKVFTKAIPELSKFALNNMLNEL